MEKRPLAIVTGASRGIGLALAKELSENGYDVVGTSRNPESCEQFSFMKLERLDLSDVQTINAFTEKYPNVDLLINNAGSSQIGSIEEISEEAIRETMDVNFINHVLFIKNYIPGMRERKSGIIVNVTSYAGKVPLPYCAFYAAAKGAMDTFTVGLRNELKEFGIKVFAVAPFQINTGIRQREDFSKSSPYFDRIIKVQKIRSKAINSAVGPDYAARQIMQKIKEKNPPFHSAVGRRAKALEFLVKLAPVKILENRVRKIFELDA